LNAVNNEMIAGKNAKMRFWKLERGGIGARVNLRSVFQFK
jgi:hypothetical protein